MDDAALLVERKQKITSILIIFVKERTNEIELDVCFLCSSDCYELGVMGHYCVRNLHGLRILLMQHDEKHVDGKLFIIIERMVDMFFVLVN